MDPTRKQYVVIVQCQLAQQRCSGYLCEKAFHERTSAFEAYGTDQPLRLLMTGCGGCSGGAVQRKVAHLLKRIEQHEGIGAEAVVVHLSSCLALDNHHSPPCPNLEAIRTILDRLGVDVREGTRFSPTAERRRAEGLYKARRTD